MKSGGAKVAEKKFWADGIKFECQGTGRCCVSRGDYGYVYLTLADRQRFAKHFNITTSRFTRDYCEKTEGWYHLKEFKSACRFLEGTKCTAYEARPTQCRTWPFWPENMNAKAWQKEVVAYCPGVGRGRHYSANEIKALMAQDPMNEG
jgi:Fe-S-cluster containining protein